MRKFLKRGLFYGVLLIFVFGSISAQALVKASVRPSTVREGEKTELVLSSQDKALTNASIDTSDLEKLFRITNRGTQIQTSYVNGKSRTLSILTLTLTPLQPGVLTIPALKVDGEETEELSVKVLPASSSLTFSSPGSQKGEDSSLEDDDFDDAFWEDEESSEEHGQEEEDASAPPSVFLESVVSPEKGYVDSAFAYTVKLYYNTASLNGRIEDPALEGARIERMGEDKTYQEEKNGVLYEVAERTFLIFPTKPGTFEISPAAFSGTVAAPLNKRERELFDPFGLTADVLYMGRMGQKEVFLKAPAASVKILPIPEKFRGKAWLPAKSLSLSESWAPEEGEIPLGEAVTRTITVRSTGAAEEILPRLVMPPVDGIKVYEGEEKVSSEIKEGVYTAIKEKSFVFMPTKAGRVVLPDARISWFNITEGKEEEASLPSKTVFVNQATGVAGRTTGAGKGYPSASSGMKEKFSSKEAASSGLSGSEIADSGAFYGKGKKASGKRGRDETDTVTAFENKDGEERSFSDGQEEDVNESELEKKNSGVWRMEELFLFGIGVGLGALLSIAVLLLFLLFKKKKNVSGERKSKKPLKDLYPY